MWKYNHVETDYLQHRLVDGRRVKYVAKVPLGGDKFRYFYDTSEYKAYLSSKKTASTTTKKQLAVKATVAAKNASLPTADTKANIVTTTTHKPTVTKTVISPTSGKNLKTTSAPSKSSPSISTNSADSKKNTLDKIKDSVRDLDPNVKKAVDTAANAVKFLAGGKRGSNSVLSNVIDAIGEKRREGQEFQTLSELPKQTKQRSADQDQKLINPDYNSAEMRYSMNCAYCSATWDLRRRGYEVEARPYTNEYDTDLAEIASWYRDTGMEDFVGFSTSGLSSADRKEASRILGEEMLAQGEGAYGNFVMYWTGGAGHSVAWSVENGKLLIRDTQLNTVDTWDDYMKKHEPYMNVYCYLRTDNREINANILEVCRERRVW